MAAIWTAPLGSQTSAAQRCVESASAPAWTKLSSDMNAVAEYTAGYRLVNRRCSSSHPANPTTFASIDADPSTHRTASPPCPADPAGAEDDDDVVWWRWVRGEPL